MEGTQSSLADGILLIGDNGLLVRLVAANLAPLTATAVLLGPDSSAVPLNPDSSRECLPYKLILLALSRSSNEPVVVLARAGLTQAIGSIPLLIISDRTFQADPERNIFHLPFPFSAEALRQHVADLLAERVEPTPSGDSTAAKQPTFGLQNTVDKSAGLNRSES